MPDEPGQCYSELPTIPSESAWGRYWMCLRKQGHAGKHLVAGHCKQDLSGTNWERALPPLIDYCPTCKARSGHHLLTHCHNAWHRGVIVHFQLEPIGTPGSQCSALCGTQIDDPPSQLGVEWEFVTCRLCCDASNWSEPARILKPDLSDAEIEAATIEELRVAYRTLRDRRWRVFEYR